MRKQKCSLVGHLEIKVIFDLIRKLAPEVSIPKKIGMVRNAPTGPGVVVISVGNVQCCGDVPEVSDLLHEPAPDGAQACRRGST